MAITKQTAKRSTAGNAPRAEIARRAARVPRPVRPMLPGRADAHQWIMFTGSAETQWLARPKHERLPAFSFASGDCNTPPRVEAWCRANPGVALVNVQCER
jgi:hypothetical protein